MAVLFITSLFSSSPFITRNVVKASKAGYQRYQRLQNEGSSKFSAFLKTLIGMLIATCLFAGFFIDMRVFLSHLS
ncbi:hypothetical protein J4727_04630 [Providencia rettgeri]|uniref:Uncharacterized protein n=1 Tax=Providencia rettgeri TaxID=587 RepID=A0A939SJ20_PRORE|nr:hypothetical protein [Providencia rettgeri]